MKYSYKADIHAARTTFALCLWQMPTQMKVLCILWAGTQSLLFIDSYKQNGISLVQWPS